MVAVFAGVSLYLKRLVGMEIKKDCLAEWSKALASGASPKGRGFESLSSHFLLLQSNPV